MLTLSNPLHLAVVGNPPKGAHMARRRHSKRAHSKRAHKISKRSVKTLRSKWRKLTRPGGAKSHLKVHVKRYAGHRKAIKGMRGSGRKGTVSIFSKFTGKFLGTNPSRRNPAILATGKELLVTPIMSLPKSVPALFKGKIVVNAAFAVGGALTGLVGGTMLQKFTLPYLGMIPVVGPKISAAMGKATVQRVVGAAFALLSAGVVGKFGIKDAAKRNAFITGAAAAALVEAIFPGKASSLMYKIPVVGGFLAPVASPVQGMAGLFGTDDLAGIGFGAYVEAPGYQGTGAYVEAPAYQGTGAYVEAPGYQGTGAYVEAPAYQGTGDLSGYNDAVAGMGYAGEALASDLGAMGSNMASHLDS